MCASSSTPELLVDVSGLSLQVIYTPVRRSGFYKAFYVQINSLIGAKPSKQVSSWSDVLSTLRWEVMETGRKIMFLSSSLRRKKMTWVICREQQHNLLISYPCAVCNMTFTNIPELQKYSKAQNCVTFTNRIFFFWKLTLVYISQNWTLALETFRLPVHATLVLIKTVDRLIPLKTHRVWIKV